MPDNDQNSPETRPDTPELAGIDPKELMARGIAPDENSAAAGAAQWDPPSVEELGARLPAFDILEFIGRGGMGAVYKARQPGLDRLVAIKVLPPRAAASPNFTERFTREARALAKLNHPNIVAVYDFGSVGEFAYFVMELVSGVNLRKLIAVEKLDPGRALAIVPQVCDALQYAHSQGVVHRDIKPENILVSESGEVKIADFGLAKLMDPSVPELTLTGTDQLMGTVSYMAPEQLEGNPAIDHRADIFSLGVVFYELLTGELPLGRFETPSQKVEVDVRLDEVVLRALAKEPDRRYQQADDVKSDVAGIVATAATMTGTRRSHTASGATTPALAEAAPGEKGASRFSRKAIIGALWAALFFIAFPMTFMVTYVSTGEHSESSRQSGAMVSGSSVDGNLEPTPGPAAEPTAVRKTAPSVPWWRWILLPIALLSLAAPVGTTALGIMGISDVRHGQGRIRGLALAVADSLLFPLLILDLLLWLVFYHALTVFISPDDAIKIGALLALVAALISNFLIVRWVWRGSRKPA